MFCLLSLRGITLGTKRKSALVVHRGFLRLKKKDRQKSLGIIITLTRRGNLQHLRELLCVGVSVRLSSKVGFGLLAVLAAGAVEADRSKVRCWGFRYKRIGSTLFTITGLIFWSFSLRKLLLGIRSDATLVFSYPKLPFPGIGMDHHTSFTLKKIPPVP